MAITRQLLQTVAFVNQASTSSPCSVPNHSLRSTSKTIIYTKPSKVKLISFLFNLPHHLLSCVVTVYLHICLYKYWRPLDFLKGKGFSIFFIATFPGCSAVLGTGEALIWERSKWIQVICPLSQYQWGNIQDRSQTSFPLHEQKTQEMFLVQLVTDIRMSRHWQFRLRRKQDALRFLAKLLSTRPEK